ncbi:MAG: 2-oxoacid:ferredoxin oxidoreductase subunit beta [Nanoarchaeota archaeon]|nr:2-oxoacid:ferredoxin oxidoreductase subunit beta [Nanoarchaeota archaeon]
MSTIKELGTGKYVPDWCPGCGNFITLMAVKKALSELGWNKEDVVIASGIGCSSKFPQWVNTFGLHGLHGRGLPMALGVKMANKKLKVIVIGGDGDVYGEGVNHFIEAIRDNIDVTLLVFDNSIYSLTKGQASPTTPRMMVTSSSPKGNLSYPLNPLSLAISQECSFVARSHTANMTHMTDIIKKALMHEGFSFVNILQECVTFNKINTAKWFKENTYELVDHNTQDKMSALVKADETEKLPIGVLYYNMKQTFENAHTVLKQKKALIERKIDEADMDSLFKEFSV